MTVYYVVQHQVENSNNDGTFLTGNKDITLYLIQEGRPQNIGDLTIPNTENSKEAILDYFGDFQTYIQLIEL